MSVRSRGGSRHMLSLCGRPSCFAGHYCRRAHLTQNDHLTAAVAQSPGIHAGALFLGLAAIFRSLSVTQTRQNDAEKQANLAVVAEISDQLRGRRLCVLARVSHRWVFKTARTLTGPADPEINTSSSRCRTFSLNFPPRTRVRGTSLLTLL